MSTYLKYLKIYHLITSSISLRLGHLIRHKFEMLKVTGYIELAFFLFPKFRKSKGEGMRGK
jgi:hypothetical protein